MKKTAIVSLVIFLCLAFAPTLKADGHFFANFGLITDDSFTFDPLIWYFGANFDFSFGDLLFLSPEANIVSLNFKFKDFYFEPALLLNFNLGGFVVGGGVSRFFLITGGNTYEINKWMCKVNAGITSGNFRFRVIAHTPFNDFFKSFLFGVQFGIGF